MGYCPQNNALFDHMTVEEHLYYFAKLKGIQSKDRKATIENVIALLHLQEQRKKSAS